MKTTITLLLTICSLCSMGQYDLIYLTDPIGWPVEYPGASSLGELDQMIEQSDSSYSGTWLNETKMTLPKNTQGDIVVFGNYVWDETSETWVPFFETNLDFTYNSSNQITEMVRSQGVGGFSLTRYATYSLNSNGDYTEGNYVDSITFGTTTTFSIGKDELTYNSSNQLVEQVYQESSAGTTTLENEEQYLFTWTNGRVSKIENRIWDGSTWEANELQTLTYDGNGNLTEKLNQFWNGSSWQNDEKDEFTFDAQNRMASQADYVDTSGTWDAEDRSTYAYVSASNDAFDYWVEEVGDGTTWTKVMRYEAYSSGGETGYADGYLWDGTAYEDDPIRRILFNDTSTSGGNPPNPPTNLGASTSARANNTISLIWEDNSSDEVGFVIERSIDSTSFAVIDSVGIDLTMYSDTSNLTSGTQYFYRVYAYNEYGNSANSNTANATTNPLSVGEIGTQHIRVFPNPVSDILNINTSFLGTYALLSLNGKLAKSGRVTSDVMRIDVADIASGVYLLKISNATHASYRKIVIH